MRFAGLLSIFFVAVDRYVKFSHIACFVFAIDVWYVCSEAGVSAKL